MHVGAHVQSITEVNQFQQNDALLQKQQLQTSQALNRWRFPPHPPNTGESPPGYELIHIWGGGTRASTYGAVGIKQWGGYSGIPRACDTEDFVHRRGPWGGSASEDG